MAARRAIAICTVLAAVLPAAAARAADAAPKPADKPAADKPADAKAAEKLVAEPDALATSQQRLADQYRELERVLMRMRDLTRGSDPNRATLIEKALKESGDRQVNSELDAIIQLLKKDQLSDAVSKETKVNQDFQSILELLLSENRSKRIESDKARFRKYLERINRLIQDQKDLQGRTATESDLKPLSGEQNTLTDRTGKLSREVKDNEEAKNAPGGDAKKPGDAKPGDGKPGAKGDGKGDGKPGAKGDGKGDAKPDAKGDGKSDKNSDKKSDKADGKPGDGKSPGKGDAKPQTGKGDGKAEGKGEGQAKGQGKGQGQGESQPGGAQPPSDSPPQDAQDENPVRKRLDAARERMQEAENRLKEAQRKGALDEQEKALRELEQAKAQLEEILRQLREEEMRRLLAMLEGRFRHMLQVQQEIYEGTLRQDKIPLAERSHNNEIECGRLSGRETELVVEVDKVQLLLREEGSAVALPEAIAQMREDMQQVVQRLAQGKVEVVTQTIERDIVTALQEILDALKKAQKDLDNNKKKPQSGSQSGQPSDPPLIEMLSELKMIRTLQMRVNRRTDRYSKMLQGEQADKTDLIEALQRLAEQESRIHRVTRDLEMGKNQ